MWRALVLGAAGCFHPVHGITSDIDAPADSDSDTPAQYCFTPTGLFQICVDEPLQQTFTGPANGRIDTNVPASCTVTPKLPGRGTELCVIAADMIAIGKPVHGAGSRPLVFLARRGISITDVLDVDSKPAEPGAGGTATCPSANEGSNEVVVGDGAGGGAGGSFHDVGGDGGSNGGMAGTLAAGGVPTPQADLTTFGAGANGGSGGNILPTTTGGGPCGLGGGGLYLYSEDMLAVTGAVTAFGLGGFAAPLGGGGGGGGGSGGMIVLEASMVLTAPGTVLAATGGGGAGGSSSGGLGNNGGTGSFSNPGAVPQGGPATSPAGAGGNGSIGSVSRAVKGSAATLSGGGGGGGGAGVIRVLPAGQVLFGMIYPPAT